MINYLKINFNICQKMLKNYKILISKIIILIVIIFWWFCILYWNELEEILKIDKTFILLFFSILEFLFVLSFLNLYYEKPIRNLEEAIQYFLMWENIKSDELLVETTNKNVNYVIKFFKKVIFSLKDIKDEFLHGKAIKWEVELAKEIQEKMLAKKLLEIPSLNIIMRSKPAWEVGWDSYDILKKSDSENYYIYVWDATGHGVWAWFIMIMVNALIEWFVKNYESWADILANTNIVLKPRLKSNLLMSLLLIRWNEKEKKIFMTGAWHEYLLIYKQRLNKTFRIKSGWVALGMVKDISKILKEVEIKVEPWDIIVLYSDWVTEAINKPKKDWSEKLFWEDRLVEAIQSAPFIDWENYKSSISVYKSITIALSKFMWYKHTQLDDITLWVIQYKPTNFDKQKDFDKKIEKEFITEWIW